MVPPMSCVNRLLILLIVALPALTAHGEVYQWKDAEGNTVFGDRPPRDRSISPRRIHEPALRSPAAAAAEEARFRERERRLLEAMARDAAERSRLRDQVAEDPAARRVSQADQCASVREKVEGKRAVTDAAESAHQETYGEKVEKAPLRKFLASHCEGDV